MAACIGITPCFHRQSKGGNSHTALIQLQPVQVVSQYGLGGLGRTQVFQRHSHWHQHQERRHQKVPGTATRVEQTELREIVGPALETARDGRAILCLTQIGKINRTLLVWMTILPPSTE